MGCWFQQSFIMRNEKTMPTKHIDDATAAQLDELYVRCVTLTQLPVKEVEVLRLAIHKGISNIDDDDILSAMSVKDTVWKNPAETVWNEITSSWPAEGIDAENFDQLAAEHSPTWCRYPSEKCKLSIRNVLEGRFPESPMHERLFTYFDPRYDGPVSHTSAEIKKKTAAFKESLASYQGKKLSAVEEEHRNFLMLEALNKQAVILQPDGSGDFTITVGDAESAA